MESFHIAASFELGITRASTDIAPGASWQREDCQGAKLLLSSGVSALLRRIEPYRADLRQRPVCFQRLMAKQIRLTPITTEARASTGSIALLPWAYMVKVIICTGKAML